MEHVFFARFDNNASANAAMLEMSEREPGGPSSTVVEHRGHPDAHALKNGENHTLAAGLQGLLVGGTLGALIGGLILGPLNLMGSAWMAALLMGGAASIYGAISGALFGSSVIDPVLHRMGCLTARGGVWVSVVAPDLLSRDEAESTLRRHGAVVEKKHLF